MNLVLNVFLKWFLTAINWPTLKLCDLKCLFHSTVSVFNNLFSCKLLVWLNHSLWSSVKRMSPLSLPKYLMLPEPSSPACPSKGSLSWMRKNGLCKSSAVGVKLKQQRVNGNILSHLASELDKIFVNVLFRKLCTSFTYESYLGVYKGWKRCAFNA